MKWTSQTFLKGQEAGSLTDWKGRGLVRKDVDSARLVDDSFKARKPFYSNQQLTFKLILAENQLYQISGWALAGSTLIILLEDKEIMFIEQEHVG